MGSVINNLTAFVVLGCLLTSKTSGNRTYRKTRQIDAFSALRQKLGDISTFLKDGVQMQCSPNEMCIAVSTVFYNRQGITDVAMSNLQLNQPCGLDIIDENIAILCTNAGLMSCGNIMSVNDTHVTYTNSLTSNSVVDNLYPSVVFGDQWGEHVIEWDCTYPINYLVSLTSSYVEEEYRYFQIRRLIIDTSLSGTGFGVFPIAMFLYKDEKYDVVHPGPPQLGMDQTLYIGISLIDGPDSAVINVGECWATPTNNTEDQTLYNLILNDCPANDADRVRVETTTPQRHFQWNSPVFKFTVSSRVYIHCYVTVCFTNMQECAKTTSCEDRSRNKRWIDDATNEVSSDQALLSVGPVYLKEDVKIIDSYLPHSGLNKPNRDVINQGNQKDAINWFFIIAVCIVSSLITAGIIIMFIIRRFKHEQYAVET
ncbi:uromodulin [Ciona intestinalis]